MKKNRNKMGKKFHHDQRHQSMTSLDQTATTIHEYEMGDSKESKKRRKRGGIYGVFTCSKRTILILSNIVGAIVLICFGLGLGLGLNDATPKGYGVDCVSAANCKKVSDFGFICSAGTCACKDDAYFDGNTCVEKKSFKAPCNSLNNECDGDRLLECLLSTTGYICSCKPERWWNDESCELLKTYNATCTDISQCQPSLGFICNQTCTCPTGYFWTGTKCDTVKLVNENCTSNAVCDASKSLYCSLTGASPGVCTCKSLMYWDSASSTCVAQKSNTGDCATTNQCRSDLGLSCLSTKCQCSSNNYWSGSTCTKRKSNNDACSASVPCDTTLYLVCTANKCACPSTHYWDGTGCTPKLSIGASCSANQCLDISGLSCTTYCSCLSTYYWNGTCCVPKHLNLVACISTLQCREDFLLSCTSGTCQCPYTHYWASSTAGCLLRKTYTEACSYDDMCRNYLGLICRPSTCLCATTHYWDGTQCQIKKEYTDACAGLSGECNDVGRGLYCPASGALSTSRANCPTTSSTRFCDCTSTQFYDTRPSIGSNTCVSLLLNGISCSLTCQCSTTLGLSCRSLTCQCQDTHYWDGSTCTVRRTDGESCSSTVPCLVIAGLSCTSYVCRCASTYYWDGSLCQLKLEYGVTCTGLTGQCNDARGLYCPTASAAASTRASCPTSSSTGRFCDCTNSQFYDNRNAIGSNACATLLTNGNTCSLNCQCKQSVGLSCQSTKCACLTTYFWDTTSSSCQPKQYNDGYCSINDGCFTTLLLSCTSNKCQCQSTYYWSDNTNGCQPKKGYGSSCSSGQCQDYNGLTCSTSASSCVCPNNYGSGICDCPYTHYYSSGSCVTRKILGESCSADYQCKKDSSLTCQSGTCQCPTSGVWFWSLSDLVCAECPSGWEIYNGHCYLVNTNSKSWDDALAYCKSFGATFMQVNDQAEYDLLYNYYRNRLGSGNLWIGARSYSVYNFVWPDGSSLSRYSSWWCNGEPNNSGGSSSYISEGCAFMWTAGGRICFNDYSCSAACPFVCEKNV